MFRAGVNAAGAISGASIGSTKFLIAVTSAATVFGCALFLLSSGIGDTFQTLRIVTRNVSLEDNANHAARIAKCLTEPPREDYDGVEKCLSDIKDQDMFEALGVIKSMPLEKLQRYQASLHSYGVPDWRAFDLFRPTYTCNPQTMLRIGPSAKESDEGKYICTDKLEYGPNGECNVFSLGSNGQFGFEREIKRLFPQCRVYTFDCTGHWNDNSTEFHPWCFGTKDEIHDGRRFMRLSTMMKELNIDTISLLKMDIDDYEWPFFVALAEDPSEFTPAQILVEFQVGWTARPPDLAPVLFVDWQENWTGTIIKMVEIFKKLGYRIANLERNLWGYFAAEIVLVHERVL